MPVKPTDEEKEYFVREEAAKLKRAADERKRRREEERRKRRDLENSMNRFQKILVYLNTHTKNSHALLRASVLARRTGAKLKVVDVLERPAKLLPAITKADERMAKLIEEEKRERLRQAVEPLRVPGSDIETDVLAGAPFAAIIDEVLRGGHDLVMKTAEHDGSTRLFGSTAVHLMRKCPCPVWVVKPIENSWGPRILAAVDLNNESERTRELNLKIVDLGRSLAASEGGELHIVHAWQAPYEDALISSPRIPRAELDAYIKDTGARVRASMREFTEQFDFRLPSRNKHTLRGAPGVVIPRFAARRRIDLIVMGTTSRTGIAGMLIGNSAERILGQVQCSVLVVKPDGFKSPVRLVN